jgi:5'-phosphate synthase pdxT subunit
VSRLRIGVLALQGDFDAHGRALERAGAEAVEVRRVAHLAGLVGLVLPGGESTTLLHLMRDEPWFESLRAFHGRGGALFGTCAGTILLAREVVSPAQPSLGLLDATIERNAYGRQVDSFETEVAVRGHDAPLRAVFIRAPRIRTVGPGVEVLARHDGSPVLVRSGRILAGTFHPELAGDDRLHRDFVKLAADRSGREGSEAVGRAGAERLVPGLG